MVQFKARRDPLNRMETGADFTRLARELRASNRQMGNAAEAWQTHAPESLRDSVRLESFKSGVLTVVVDNAATGFALDRALRGGLLADLRTHCKATLARVKHRVGSVDQAP